MGDATNAAEPVGKLYRGAAPVERQAQRRQQLIDAAIAVYSERGYRHSSVKAVCEAAGLTERYFYESYPNSQALLVAAFEKVTAGVEQCVRVAGASVSDPGAGRVRAMLAAYFGALRADPSSARLFLIEISGVSSEVDKVLDNALGRFADLLEGGWAVGRSPKNSILKVGVTGALVRIGAAWVSSAYQQPLEEVVCASLRLASILK